MICVCIGRGRHRHVIAEHKFLADNGIGLVELRLDYIQGDVDVRRLLRDRPCPAIVTCRRDADGGRWQGTEEARLRLLRQAIAEGADYVDLEADIAAKVPRYGSTKRIISHHDYERTPAELGDLHRRLATLDADIVKIATLANHPVDNLRMLDLIRHSRLPTVGICMGEFGVPSRILGVSAGAPFTLALVSEERVLAPGQMGWRRMRDLYRVEAIRPGTRIYGVVADPVAHSLSPLLHNVAIATAGLDAVYIPFRATAEQLDSFLASANRWPLAGLSVTIPHKETVLEHCARQDGLVREIGAANTLAFNAEGCIAFNTDASAAIEALRVAVMEGELTEPLHEDLIREQMSRSIRTALVLGAGGAARAVAFGLRQQGIEVTVCGRTAERARAIAADVGCRAVEWAARHRMPHDCIVNATPVGMHPNVDETPYDKEHLRPYMIVFDTVYNPENTLFIKEARTVGCRTVTGVEMFVRQAAQQFRIWHGVDPTRDVMRDALKQATASAKPVT